MLKEKITVGEAVTLINESILNFEDGLSTDTISKIIYSVNNEIQIRDYVLGLPSTNSMETCIDFVSYIGNSVDGAERYSLQTILSAYYYELGDKDMSAIMIATALDTKSDYSLANLIQRVILTDWAPASFATMRSELHGKVVEGLKEMSDQLI